MKDTLRIYRTTTNGGNEFCTAYIENWFSPVYKDIEWLESVTNEPWECVLEKKLPCSMTDDEANGVLFYTNDLWMCDGKYGLAARIMRRVKDFMTYGC